MFLKAGKMAGAPVYVHWSVALLLLVLGWLVDFEPVPFLQCGASYFFLLVMHELGHAWFAHRGKCPPQVIVIRALGAGVVCRMPDRFADAILMLLGGVIFQAVILAAAVTFVWLADEATVRLFEPALLVLIYFNGIAIIGNLLPDKSGRVGGIRLESDGGQVLALIRKRRAAARS